MNYCTHNKNIVLLHSLRTLKHNCLSAGDIIKIKMRGRYPEHAKNRRVREKGQELRIPQSVQMDGLVLEKGDK